MEFLFALGLLFSVQQTAFYVSTTGNDSNPGTLASPFLTLGAAQTAMQSSQFTKVTYIRSGTYNQASTIVLTSSDNNETWQEYPPDGVDTAIVDGGSSLGYIFSIRGGSNIIIDSLKLQNTLYGGVLIHGGAAVTNVPSLNYTVGVATGNQVSNCEITGVADGANTYIEDVNGGAVSGEGAITGTLILNNYIHGLNWMGLELKTQHNPAATPPDDVSNSVVSGNVVLSVNLNTNTVGDAGAIYMHDWLGTSTNITVKNNFVRDWQDPGVSTHGCHCIYLDAAMSNTTVTGNVCGPPGSPWANMSSTVQLCGNNNVINNNIFDLGTTAQDTLYATGTCSAPAVLTNMAGLQFENNVVVMNFAGNQNSTWASITNKNFPTSGSGVGSPTVTHNIYNNYGGGQVITTGNVVSDASPTLADPLCSGWTYSLAANSPAYSSPISFVPITGHWGPAGLSIPQTGTAPSCPH